MVQITRESDLMVVGANGGGWVAPVGTAQPTGQFTVPGAPWLALGAISDAGLVDKFTEARQDFTPWGLLTPARSEVTSSVRSFDMVLWETRRPIVRSVFFRVPVSQVTPATGTVNFAETASPVPDHRSWLFDIYDGNQVERMYLPDAEMSNRADVNHDLKNMEGYNVTINAYPDAAGNTVYHLYTATVALAS